MALVKVGLGGGGSGVFVPSAPRWSKAIGVVADSLGHAEPWDGVLLCGPDIDLRALVFVGLAQDLPFRVQDALRLGFIGYLFNYVAPGAVGGDLIKASMIAREQTERRLVAVATVFLDRVVGLVGLLILGALMMFCQTPLLLQKEFQYVVGIFQLGSVISLVGMVVVLLPGLSQLSIFNRLAGLPKVGRIFAELINSLRLYQSRWRVLVLSLLMSLVSHTGLILSIYFCAIALHGTDGVPSLLIHLQIVPPAELVGVVVPLPGGTGALEEAMAHFYVLAGGSYDRGFLTAVAYRLVTIVIAVVGAVWYLLARREIDAVLEETHPPEVINEAVPSTTNSSL